MVVTIALLVGLTIGLTEVIKRTSSLDKKYLPLVSLLFGIALSVVWVEGSIKDGLLQGIIVGLSASGLFDQTKIVGDDK